MTQSLSCNHLINLNSLWCLCLNQMTNCSTWHGPLCISRRCPYKANPCRIQQGSPTTKGVVCFGSGYLFLGCLRDAESNNNQSDFFYLCFSVQQWLCACVWLQWGELPEWVLPEAGCLQAAERDTCGLGRILCHRYAQVSLKTTWIASPIPSCFLLVPQINLTIYWRWLPFVLVFFLLSLAFLKKN